MTSKTMNMKLLMDGESKKLLFAEAGKDVVDFLFSLFALPLGTLTKLLRKENMPGAIGCLYKSIEGLDVTYFQSGDQSKKKTLLLNPSTTVSALKSTFLYATNTVESSGNYYLCDRNPCPNFIDYPTYFTDVYKTRCTGFYNCPGEMSKAIKFRVPIEFAGSEGGFVKDMVVYTVMDDLSIVPMSSVCNIKKLDRLNIKDLTTLEERIVNIGLEEGLKMVKAALQSKTVLTDVFLAVKAALQSKTVLTDVFSLMYQ